MARSSSLPEFLHFDASSHPGNELKAFNTWLRRFENRYLVVTSLAADATAAVKEADMKAWLLNYVADDVLDGFEAMYATTDLWKAATYSDVVKKYRELLKPNQTLTLLRHRFLKLVQGTDESFDAFVSKVKKEITYCEYSCDEDVKSITRDQIVKGVKLVGIREGALKNDWSLADLIRQGRRIESANASITELRSSSDSLPMVPRTDAPIKSEPINKVHTSSQKRPARHAGCNYCGQVRCRGGEHCMAHGKRCNYCFMVNHFESVCLRKKKNIPPPRGSMKKTNVVTVGEDSDSDRDGTYPSPQGTSYSRLRSVPIKAMSLRNDTPKTVSITVDGITLHVLPDSGAEANVISLRHLPPSCASKICATKTVLHPYKSMPIYPRGKVHTLIKWNSSLYSAKWYVVEDGTLGNETPLLSRKASEKLGILVINTTPPHPIKEHVHKRENIFTVDSIHKGDPDGPLNIPDNLQALKNKFKHLFSGVGKLNNRKIRLYPKKEVKPRIAPYRPVPVHLVGKVNDEINSMLEQDIIEEVTGPVEWCSNLVIVPKPDSSEIRVTVDLRAVNQALQNTHKPIPTIETLKSKFHSKTVFSKVDFKSAFSQIEVEESSRKFLVFRGGDRLYRYKRMTMGLLPASGEFMDVVAPQFQSIRQMMMIHDDATISGENQQEHDDGLRAFFKRADELGLTLNEAKCIFSKPQIPFWGVIISKDGIRPNPLKVQTLQQQVSPSSKEELISFLAMVRANDAFIPNIPQGTTLLRNLTKKGVHFKWTDEHEKEFCTLKNRFNEQVLLQHFDPALPTYIFVDASIHGFGAILCQGHSIESCVPVTVASRTTRGGEPRYPQIDLEAMAIDFALRRFRFYIVGGPQVTVVTDHKPLVPIFSSTRLGTTRTEKVKLQHQDMDYVVTYQQGKSNMSDYFSRHAVPIESLDSVIQQEAEEHAKLLYSLTVCPYTTSISRDLIRVETEKDDLLRRLKLAIHLGYLPPEDQNLRPFKTVFNELSTVDDIVYRDNRMVLPSSLQEAAIDNAHQGGHPGIARLKSHIRTYYWFPGLDDLVEHWVKSCECQLYVKDRMRNPITSAPTPSQPWQDLSVDMYGPMPSNEHILVVRDNLSRFPAAELVKSTASSHVVPAMDQIYSNFGTPASHKTDSGPPFNGADFAKYSKDNNIVHKRTPPLHPQSNEAECVMKPLGKAMKLAHHNRLDKKKELGKFLRQYRATPHPSTGVPPGDIMLRGGYNTGKSRTPPPDNIVEIVKLADKKSKAKNRMVVNNQRFCKRRNVVQGQLTLVRNDQRCRKFDPYYEKEPYVVTDIRGELLLLQRHSDGRMLTRHLSHTKPYIERSPGVVECPGIPDIEYCDELEDNVMPIMDSATTDTTPGNNNTVEADNTQPDNANDTIPHQPIDRQPIDLLGAVPQPIPGPSVIPQSTRCSNRERTSTKDTVYKDFV